PAPPPLLPHTRSSDLAAGGCGPEPFTPPPLARRFPQEQALAGPRAIWFGATRMGRDESGDIRSASGGPPSESSIRWDEASAFVRSEEHTSELQSVANL